MMIVSELIFFTSLLKIRRTGTQRSVSQEVQEAIPYCPVQAPVRKPSPYRSLYKHRQYREERQQEYKDMFLLRQFDKCPAQTLEAVSHHMFSCLGEILLPVGAQKRHRRSQPPDCCDDKSKDHGSLSTQPYISAAQYDHKTDHKRNTASDVSHAYPWEETESIRSGSVTSVSIAS